MSWGLLRRRSDGVQAVGRTVTHIEPSAPDKQDFTNDLLQAADVLEGVKAHIEQMMDSLHYFADLGSGEASRDFVKVRQQLANTRALIGSSPLALVKVQELVITLRAVVTEEGTRRTNTAKQPAARSDTGPSRKDQNERQEVNIVLSDTDSFLATPKSDNHPTVPGQKDQTDQKGQQEDDELLATRKSDNQLPASLSRKDENERQKVDVVASEVDSTTVTPESQTQLTSGLTPKVQHEQEKVSIVLAEIEELLGKPKFNARPMAHVGATQMRENENEHKKVVILAEIDGHLRKPKTGDKLAAPLRVPLMQSEQQKENDPLLQEVEAILGKDWGFLLESIPGKSK